MKSNEVILVLQGLDCANCANKIENRVNELEGVKEASLNFVSTTITIELKEEGLKEEIINVTKEIVNSLEPHVKVFEKNKLKENHKGHSHNHSHDKENEDMNYFEKSLKARLSIGAIIYALAFIMKKNYNDIATVLFVISYVLIGVDIVASAFKNILKGEVFDENFLMTIATFGAFLVGEHSEGVAVMLFYQIGELFQSYAVNKSRKSITSLMNIRADYANLIKFGKEEKVNPETVNIDDIIIIKAGEKVPLDGVVIDGSSFLDTSALTGESVPREVFKNDDILAGCINKNGVLKVKVTKIFGESTVSKILELVENASNKKAKVEKFLTKFTKVYTPIVVFSALALAILPPLFIANATFSEWIYRALIFLVVSCPCALVVSIPLALFAGIGGASRKGILVKGGNYLQSLKDVDTVVFDKTGTLTKGIFKITEINPKDISREKLLEVAAIAESLSNHPIAQSIIKEYGKDIKKESLSDYEELAGLGIKAKINNLNILVGNYKLMKEFNIEYDKKESIGTIVHIAINNKYSGNIVISDEIKESSISAVKELKNIGVSNIVMLTGDSKSNADKVAEKIGIDKVFAELLPGDKVEKIEDIIKENSGRGKVLFVGDGINDAPVLARVDIGVAMGGIGSDAAIEACDIVLIKDDPYDLVTAIKGARKTNKILWQNIVFSLGIKGLVLLAGAFGFATMWEAVFADVGVALIAVINATRCLK